LKFTKGGYRYPILAGTVLIFVVIWYVVSLFVSKGAVSLSPIDTARGLVQIFSDPSIRGEMFSSLGTTLVSVFSGFVIAAVIGIPVGILMGRYLYVELLVDPWVSILYSIPAIAFVALSMSWAGSTSTSAVAVASLLGFVTIVINVYQGCKNVSASLVEPATAFGADRRTVLFSVLFPAILPNVMLGLRLGITRALEGVILAEMTFSVVGLGGMIFDTADKLQIGLTIALIMVLSVISIILNQVVKYVDYRIVFWRRASALNRG
jgi:ABC-type nitrate/sulfonate/bicarbonate transport system permease component